MRGAGFARTTARKTPVRSTSFLVAWSLDQEASRGNFNLSNHDAKKQQNNKTRQQRRAANYVGLSSSQVLVCSHGRLPQEDEPQSTSHIDSGASHDQRDASCRRGVSLEVEIKMLHETVQTSTRYVLTFLARLYAGFMNARCCCCCASTRLWTARWPPRAAAAPRTAVLNMEEALPRFIVVVVLSLLFRLSHVFFGNGKICRCSTKEINDCADNPSEMHWFYLSPGISLCLTLVWSCQSFRCDQPQAKVGPG